MRRESIEMELLRAFELSVYDVHRVVRGIVSLRVCDYVSKCVVVVHFRQIMDWMFCHYYCELHAAKYSGLSLLVRLFDYPI